MGWALKNMVPLKMNTSPQAQIMSSLENWSKLHTVTAKNEAAVAFLLSGDASYITRASIFIVDGYLAT